MPDCGNLGEPVEHDTVGFTGRRGRGVVLLNDD